MFAAVLIIAVIALAVAASIVIVQHLTHICPPNEVLVISGSRRSAGARKVGYRLVQGGRGMAMPLLERVDRLDLTNMKIDVVVNNAYSKGGIPLSVAAVANVKIASSEPTIGNAIERFLGKPRGEVQRVAKETLEGNLRGVLATLTPEEVNQDRVKFAQSLLQEADTDLKRLGLTLDTLKIQHVSDEKGYLDSIGRKQSADLQMRSRVAEADNQAQAAERAAHNQETAELARIDEQIALAQADAERRVLDARSRRGALVAEERARVTALVARAEAELEVQQARIEQVRLALQADRIRPAEAKRTQMIAAARGEAATIVEEGRATARSLREMGAAWHRTGGDASRIFVAQKLGSLIGQLLSTVEGATIDQVTVVDRALTGNGGSLAAKALVATEQLKHGLGVDLPDALRRLSAGAGPSVGARLDENG